MRTKEVVVVKRAQLSNASRTTTQSKLKNVPDFFLKKTVLADGQLATSDLC